jgi:membrane-bound serine protease (ClpP class)
MSVEMILGIWLIGLGCLSVELFVASVSLGVAGLVLFMGSIAAMFISPHGGVAWGAGLSLTSLVAGGAILKIAATRLTHRHTLTASDGYVGTDDLSGLIGQEGVTSTLLRPGGFATIGGRRVDVVTNGEIVEEGVPVEVVAVEGNRVEVRPKQSA